jgi:hypothetical protein
MPDDNLLLQYAKQLPGQSPSPTNQRIAVPIFAALLIADSIRTAGKKIAKSDQTTNHRAGVIRTAGYSSRLFEMNLVALSA